MSNPVTILSYNSTGFPVQRQSYLRKLLTFSDIICGQEHFQLKGNKFRISNSIGNSFDLFFKPAVKSDKNLTQGRPKGGLFIAWRKMCVKKVTRIMCESFRLQAVILEYSDCRLLIINTYFPCDNQKLILSESEAVERQNLLADIMSLQHKYVDSYDVSIILGDLNFDDTRYTGHAQLLHNFMEGENLRSVWDIFPVDFTFTSGNAFSVLDHFLLDSTKTQKILDAGVLHDPENLSGHSPIYLKFDLVKADIAPEIRHRNPRINWSRSSQEQISGYVN